MRKNLIIFAILLILTFLTDQFLKGLFLEGLRYQSQYIDLVLVFNKGVAFSMLSFLGENLKYIQLVLLGGFFVYLLWEKKLFCSHIFAFGLIFGAGFSNIYDRFIHGGVVDYVFWHKWFNFAVFNFADVMIDLGIVIIFIQTFFSKK